MANANSPLSRDAIASILEKDKHRTPTKRTKKNSTEPRIYDTWWKLFQHYGRCSNPHCCDPRPGGGKNGTAMVIYMNEAEVANGATPQAMCRFCFLGGWLSNE